MSHPTKAPLVARVNDGELILLDPQDRGEYRLNSVGALIWQLCDGTRDAATITSELAGLFEKRPADIAAEVEGILAQFIDSGLVYAAPGPRAENDLLLRLVRTALGTESGEWMEGLAGESVDWRYLVRTARRHGVMPLLYRGISPNHKAVPPSVLTELQRHFHASARQTRLLTDELLELLDLFEEHQIPAMPLKGPLLAWLLYRDLSLRQFGDLDIFVPADQAARARSLLITRGYRFLVSQDTDALAKRARGSATVVVDLQWSLGPKRFRFPLNLETLWSRLEPVPFEGIHALQPAPADHLLILCAHAGKHCWSQLNWISDVAAFVRTHPHIDWPAAIDRAAQLGGERLLLLGLQLAADVLSADVPDAVRARMRADASVGPISAELGQRLFAVGTDPTSFQGSYGLVEGGLLYMKTRERVRDKLPYALHLLARPMKPLTNLFTPTHEDRAVVALPRSAALLYFLVRPIRLTKKHGTRLLHRYWKRPSAAR